MPDLPEEFWMMIVFRVLHKHLSKNGGGRMIMGTGQNCMKTCPISYYQGKKSS